VFMDTYVTWLLYDVNGQFIPVAQVPDYSAFHYMYMVAIALMFLSLIASLFTKNYVIKARQEVKREVVEAKHPG
ncbi:MAG: MFS transporter, partial [Metallosphaera sp.]